MGRVGRVGGVGRYAGVSRGVLGDGWRGCLLEEDAHADFCQVFGRRLRIEVELRHLGGEVGRRGARHKEVEDVDRPLLLPAWVGVRVVGLLVLHLVVMAVVVPAGGPAGRALYRPCIFVSARGSLVKGGVRVGGEGLR